MNFLKERKSVRLLLLVPWCAPRVTVKGYEWSAQYALHLSTTVGTERKSPVRIVENAHQFGKNNKKSFFKLIST